MPLSRRTRNAACVLCLASSAAALSFAAELPPDPRNLHGTLDNGVRWIFRAHDNPPNKMALMIHVNTGSLNETEPQRGLAHFLEHMAFNGSENFPPGELIPYFERIGMEFGADLNAFTSFDQTAYMLFLPDTTVPQVDKGLMVLSDYAFRLLLTPEEIDKERGVILEELRAGQSAQQRMRDELYTRLFDGMRLGERLPIGTEEVIAHAPREQFVDYYRTWYRPERITLLMVGDADFEQYRALVEKWFGQYRPEIPARPEQPAGLHPFGEQRALVITDPEYAQGDITLIALRPGRPPVTTTALARQSLVEDVATWIVSRRLGDRVRRGEASYQDASASIARFYNEALLVNASATGKPEAWEQMLEELVVEISRAREHGFLSRELELARAEFISRAERAVRTESTRDARALLFTLMRDVNAEEPTPSAQQELDLLNQLMPTIKLEELNKVFAERFAAGNFAWVLEMPEKEGVAVPAEEQVLAAARAALALQVAPLDDHGGAHQLLSAAPQPGAVVEKQPRAHFDITSGWLANGVRFHHRFMDYKKDTVYVSIALAGGQIEETAENIGVTTVAALAFRQDQAATQRLSSTEISDLMTGKNIRVSAAADDDALIVQAVGSPRDLETGLQLVHALLMEGQITEAAFTTWQQGMVQRLTMAQSMPEFKAFEAFRKLLGNDDARLALPTPERIARQSREAGQAWLARMSRAAPLEVAIVGDLSLDEALPLLERYLGSLPARPRTAEHLDALRKIDRPAGPLTQRIEVPTITPKAMVLSGFVGADATAVDDTRMLQLASNILTSRLIKALREEGELVYSIQASNQPERAYRDAGLFFTGAPCNPERVDEVSAKIDEIFQSFVTEGPTSEELANARKQVENNLDTQLKEPSYWWSILRSHDLHRIDLAKLATIREDFANYTAEQIRATFAKYYTPERTLRVLAIPAPEALPIPAEAGAP